MHSLGVLALSGKVLVTCLLYVQRAYYSWLLFKLGITGRVNLGAIKTTLTSACECVPWGKVLYYRPRPICASIFLFPGDSSLNQLKLVICSLTVSVHKILFTLTTCLLIIFQ